MHNALSVLATFGCMGVVARAIGHMAEIYGHPHHAKLSWGLFLITALLCAATAYTA